MQVLAALLLLVCYGLAGYLGYLQRTPLYLLTMVAGHIGALASPLWRVLYGIRYSLDMATVQTLLDQAIPTTVLLGAGWYYPLPALIVFYLYSTRWWFPGAVTGLLTYLIFVLYHLLHFTFGVIDAENTRLLDAEQRLDVYTSLVSSFQNPWISGTYIVAMVLIGLHLWHGLASTFQTFGLRHESYQTLIRVGSIILVALLVIGNCSIPIMIMAGRVSLGAD